MCVREKSMGRDIAALIFHFSSDLGLFLIRVSFEVFSSNLRDSGKNYTHFLLHSPPTPIQLGNKQLHLQRGSEKSGWQLWSHNWNPTLFVHMSMWHACAKG